MAALIALIVILPILYFIKISRKPPVIDENSFSQKGVRVDFNARTISIKNYTYNVDLITGLSYVKTTPGGTGVQSLALRAEVKIQVDDFKKPVHIINFMGLTAHNDADDFMQRISLALRKADGPSFV